MPNEATALESSSSLDKIIPALLAARDEIQPVKKDAVNPHFKSRYATLAAILEACQGPLSRNRILISFPIRPTESGGLEIACVLLHESSQWVRSRAVMPIQVTAKPQEVGSAITYFCRYLAAPLLAIATEDDDGEAATSRSTSQASRPARPQAKHYDQPGEAAGIPETWSGYCARECHRINDEWRNEMVMANIEKVKRDDFKLLINPHQLVNAVCSRAIEKGLIPPGDVSLDGGKTRDRKLADLAVSTLFMERPKSIKATVEKYVLEKVSEARQTLGMAIMEEAANGRDA